MHFKKFNHFVSALLLALVFYVQDSNQSCPKDSEDCDSIQYDWRENVQSVEAYDSKQVIKWVHTQLKKVTTFCPFNSELGEVDEKLAAKIIKEPAACLQAQKTQWTGKWDKKTGLPKGPGMLTTLSQVHQSKQIDKNLISNDQEHNKMCMDVNDIFERFNGKFSSGYPSGHGTAYFAYDESRIEGEVKKGAFHGKVSILHHRNHVEFVGSYHNGRAEGPGWIIPNDWQKSGFVHAIFEGGGIRNNFVLHVTADFSKVVGGRLNGTRLEEAKQYQVKTMADYNCIKFLRQSDLVEIESSSSLSSPHDIPMMMKLDPESGLMLFRSPNTMIFNRIAKTGSQSLIELLVQLRNKTDIKVIIDQRKTEQLMEPPRMVADFVRNVYIDYEPSVTVRHYNFVNFKLYGAIWNPIYINIVRDPIDRIISWFYYWRAAWNIVERKLAFPNEPLPDPKLLRKDFDSCVLTGDPECQFIQGSNVLLQTDHRSQIMSFCGHDLFCAEFNGKRAFQQAKENAEKFYTVIGVLENMNKTLQVLEKKLPHFFEGAFKLYHTHPEIQRKQNKNAYKLPVSNEVMNMVRKNFTLEIEFYEFLKQRLDHQYETLFPEA